MNINNSIKNTILHLKGEVIWLYAGRFSAVLLQSVSMLIVSLVAGLDEFGRFSFMFSAARLISVFIAIGGAALLERELPAGDAKYSGCGNLNLFINVLFRMSGAAILVLLIFYFIYVQGVADYDIFFILLAGYLISFFEAYISVVRVAKSASYSMILRDSIPYLLFLIGMLFYMWFSDLTALSLLNLFSLSLVICIFTSFIVSYLYLSSRRNTSNAKQDSRSVLAFWGGAIIGTSLAQLDVIIAKIFLNDTELGAYALLRRITNLLSLPQIIVNWSINVDIAKSYVSEKKSVLQDLAVKGLYIAVPVSLFMCVSIMLTSTIWLEIFGVEVSVTTYLILLLLASAQLVNVMSGANLLFALQCNEEMFVLRARFISLLIAITLMLAGGYFFGSIGVAAGISISIVILNLLVTKHVKDKIGIWTSVSFLRI